MISPDQVEAMIKTGLPDAQVQVQDLTGGGDHYQVTVVSSHALALNTFTPEEWSATGQEV
jgi:acid stress-induced BolA-like protein IbaG/YrbA